MRFNHHHHQNQLHHLIILSEYIKTSQVRRIAGIFSRTISERDLMYFLTLLLSNLINRLVFSHCLEERINHTVRVSLPTFARITAMSET